MTRRAPPLAGFGEAPEPPRRLMFTEEKRAARQSEPYDLKRALATERSLRRQLLNAKDKIRKLEDAARDSQMRNVAVSAIANLAAAVSLLERIAQEFPQAKAVVPSDRMFDQMLKDYAATIEVVRRVIKGEAP